MTDEVDAAELDVQADELPAPVGASGASGGRAAGSDWTIPISVGVMQLAGLASIGAGAIHAGLAGVHADHVTLSRLFVAVAVAQIGVGLVALVKGGKVAASLVVGVSIGAVVAWAYTRLSGVSWIDGLQESEQPQFTDTACAVLGAIAAVSAAGALVVRRTAVSAVRLGVPAMSVGVVALIAMLTGTNHSHADNAAASQVETAAIAAEPAAVEPAAAAVTGHEHTAGAPEAAPDPTEGAASPTGGDVVTAAGTGAEVQVQPAVWPRPWNPDQPIDLSGVPGVTPEQQLRVTMVLQRTLELLPQFADVDTIGARGYRSMGDGASGHEHYINRAYMVDEHFLNPEYPESLVYRVNGEGRTLVGAMFMVDERPADDPLLVEFGGPLMEWHVHTELCFREGDPGAPRQIAGRIDADGNCPEGSVQRSSQRPMLHIWIVARECGPFSELNRIDPQTPAPASDVTTDPCAHEHDGGAAAADG